MHTAEIEHEHHPLAQRLPFLRNARFLHSEDTLIANLAAWTFGPVIFTIAGFYFGSIAGHDNHQYQLPNVGSSIVTSAAPDGAPWREAGMALHKDLDPLQLANAIPFALAGLLLAVAFALWVSFWYTPAKLKELGSEGLAH